MVKIAMTTFYYGVIAMLRPSIYGGYAPPIESPKEKQDMEATEQY